MTVAMTDYDQAARILRAAAKYMRKHGKCRDSYMDADGRVCMLGALWMIPDGRYSYRPASKLALATLRRIVGGSIPRFSDSRSRTACLAKFEKAAQSLEKEELRTVRRFGGGLSPIHEV